MAHIEVTKNLCKGCKLCIRFCPKNILRIGEEINIIGDHYVVQDDPAFCIGCAMCAVMCPESAITVYR